MNEVFLLIMTIIAILIIVFYYLPIILKMVKNSKQKKKNPNDYLVILSDNNSDISSQTWAIDGLSQIGYFGVYTINNKGNNYSDKKQESIFCDSLNNHDIVNNLFNVGAEQNG